MWRQWRVKVDCRHFNEDQECAAITTQRSQHMSQQPEQRHSDARRAHTQVPRGNQRITVPRKRLHAGGYTYPVGAEGSGEVLGKPMPIDSGAMVSGATGGGRRGLGPMRI